MLPFRVKILTDRQTDKSVLIALYVSDRTAYRGFG